MRQVIAISAINAQDLRQLIEDVGKILLGLLHIPVEDQDVSITFRWKKELKVTTKSANSNREYCPSRPAGISVGEWANIISDVIEIHIMSGSRFNLVEPCPSLTDTEFNIYLRRP